MLYEYLRKLDLLEKRINCLNCENVEELVVSEWEIMAVLIEIIKLESLEKHHS